MAWNLDDLIKDAPLGFQLLMRYVFYDGSIPEGNMIFKIPVTSKLEIVAKSREIIKNKSNILVVQKANRGGTEYFAYHIKEEKLDGLYDVLRKLYDGWYEKGNVPDMSTILEDEREFQRNEEDFESFKTTMMNWELVNLSRYENNRTVGEILVLSYLDYLRINFENKIPSMRKSGDTNKIYDIMRRYNQADGNILAPEIKKKQK